VTSALFPETGDSLSVGLSIISTPLVIHMCPYSWHMHSFEPPPLFFLYMRMLVFFRVCWQLLTDMLVNS